MTVRFRETSDELKKKNKIHKLIRESFQEGLKVTERDVYNWAGVLSEDQVTHWYHYALRAGPSASVFPVLKVMAWIRDMDIDHDFTAC